jgi:hypothetical protein
MLLATTVGLAILAGVTVGPSIENPSFEALDKHGAPTGWRLVAWGREGLNPAHVCGVVEDKGAPGGRRVARIAPEAAQYDAVAQQLKGLVPGRWYEVSCMVRCRDLQGQGCFLNLEYWSRGIGYGCVDSEHLVGTVGWTRAAVRFQASGPDFTCNLSCWQIGGPGECWFDDLRLRETTPPRTDLTRRRILDGPFWGMFTCYANYLHQYGKDMQAAGVHWQRQGGSALAPEQQAVAASLGMAYEMCLDGMPSPAAKDDPCYPVTSSPAYLDYLRGYLDKAGPTIRAWEVFNEPNNNLAWTLPAYANLLKLAGRTIKERRPDAIFATGGFAVPEVGYLRALLRRGAGDVLDLALLHPYAVDEALDSALFAVTDALLAGGRPDMAVAINETGWATWDPATGCEAHNMFVSEAEQARDVVKLHIQALAHRLSFVTYLGWNDFTEPSDYSRNMGLIRVDGTPKPSWHAYRFMTATVRDRRVAAWSYGDDGTRIYKFTGAPPVWVLWNALREGEATVDTGDEMVFACDLYGAKLSATPRKGKVSVRVTTEPVYLVPTGPG